MWGLIFDVDGVIADTEKYNAIAAAVAFEEVHGVQIDPHQFYHFAGTGELAYFMSGARLAGVHTPDIDALVESWQRYFWLLVSEHGFPPPLPGLDALLEAAYADGSVLLGIATSGQPEKQLRIVAEAGVDVRRFHAIVTGADVERKKPDPQIYELCAERLGLPAWECVVGEDTKAGIDAANRADMRCVALASTAGIYELYASDRMIQSIEDISLEDMRVIARSGHTRTGN